MMAQTWNRRRLVATLAGVSGMLTESRLSESAAEATGDAAPPAYLPTKGCRC